MDSPASDDKMYVSRQVAESSSHIVICTDVGEAARSLEDCRGEAPAFHSICLCELCNELSVLCFGVHAIAVYANVYVA